MANKYNAKKVTIDGIVFDSKAEGSYYNLLKMMQKTGKIKKFERQVQFVLIDSFDHPSKKTKAGRPCKVSAIKFTPDFVVTMPDGSQKVVDVKGMMSRDFPLRAKLFMQRYNVPLILANKTRNGFEYKEI